MSVIPGAWLALEGASELVPVGWREVSAALRVAGGLALIAVGVMALWWLILVSLVEPGRYS